MPRKKIVYSSIFPYHITSRSNHKNWFSANIYEAWDIALKSLKIANTKYPARIHAFVLMNNHYHMVISTPDANISFFMYVFNKNFSLQLRKKTNLINRMFGGRYKWSLIQNQVHYSHVMKYVFLNPNKASLVQDASEYRFSTLYLQKHKLYFPATINPYFNVLEDKFIKWLHDIHSPEQSDSISRGLTRTSFKFSATRENRTPPSFDTFG